MSNSTGTSQSAQDHDVTGPLIRALAWMLVVSGLLIGAAQIAQIGVPRAGPITLLGTGVADLRLNRTGRQRMAVYLFFFALLVLAAFSASYYGPTSAAWVALPISTMVAGLLLALLTGRQLNFRLHAAHRYSQTLHACLRKGPRE